jgi:cytidylate kinase
LESPLKIADGAEIIDNGNLTIAQSFEKILEKIKISNV